MTAFSLGTTWEETIAFLRREAGLLIPVAVAVYGPADALMELVVASAPNGHALANPMADARVLLMLPAVLMVLYGHVSVTLITLVPGISVAEALIDALRRLPRALVTFLLLGLITSMAMVAIVVVATLAGMAVQADPRVIETSSGLYALMAIPLFVLFIRIVLVLVPVLTMEQLGPMETIRRCWQLTRHNSLRLIGVFLLMLFLEAVVALIEQFVIGSLVQLLRLAMGPGELLTLLQTLIDAALDALLYLATAVYFAMIYRRIAAS